MSDSVKLSSALAKDDEVNGLDGLADELVENPKQIRVAVIYFDVAKIVDKTDDDSRIPYARIRRFEPIGTVDEVPDKLRDLLQQAVEDRTGKTPLPFGEVDAIEVD